MKFLAEKKKILVVDDIKLNFSIIQKILQDYPLELEWAHDSAAVPAYIKENHFDLILVSYDLPKIGGVELCRQIKGQTEIKEIPLFIFIAANDQKSLFSAFEAGADDFITKPIIKPELIARLERLFLNQVLTSKLQEKLEEQKSLARVISHDLGNYIGIAKLSADTIKRSLSTQTVNSQDQEAMKALIVGLERMGRAVSRMQDLLKNVRNLQALEDNKESIELAPYLLSDLINDVLTNFEQKIEQKDIRIQQTWINGLNPLDTNVLLEPVTALNSVFGNILSNAIKFSHPGGLIEINVKENRPFVDVTVRDYGIGMSSDLSAKVFSKTEKTSRPGTANETGTGFGMPLAKMFMEKYAGKISLTSNVDEVHHGTAVTLSFKRT